MEFVMMWIWASSIVALFGMERKIGSHEAFLFSLVFTPVIGFVLTMASGAKDDFDREAHEILRKIRMESAGNKVMIDPMQNEKGLTPEMELRLFQETKLVQSTCPESLIELEKLLAEKEIHIKSKVA